MSFRARRSAIADANAPASIAAAGGGLWRCCADAGPLENNRPKIPGLRRGVSRRSAPGMTLRAATPASSYPLAAFSAASIPARKSIWSFWMVTS